jgi:spectrin alpha
VDALLASEDYGKDLASVNNLLKKHQLLEADISAHEVSGMPDLPASHY